jgi:hypothetical protein
MTSSFVSLAHRVRYDVNVVKPNGPVLVVVRRSYLVETQALVEVISLVLQLGFSPADPQL